MHGKLVSLIDLTHLLDDEGLSKSYVRYIAGHSLIKQYRHHELLDIASLIATYNLDESSCANFLYGYEIPQLNKEFDLLRVGKKELINIELKSQQKAISAMTKQLVQNRHYLKFLSRQVHCFVYVSSSGRLYQLDGDRLIETTGAELLNLLKGFEDDDLDLDEAFSPSSILVSPLLHPQRFLQNDYLLSANQSYVKNLFLKEFRLMEKPSFYYSLVGGPGTGKTLLLYDIAKTLSENNPVLIVHPGLTKASSFIEEAMPNLRISNSYSLIQQRFDFIFVDEAYKLGESDFEKIVDKAKEDNSVCLFSYDPDQKIFLRKTSQAIIDRMITLSGANVHKLRYRIRVNREMLLFSSCLKDLGNYRQQYEFPHVSIIYEPDLGKAEERASSMEGYRYLRFLPKKEEVEKDDKSVLEAYERFDEGVESVVMVLDSHFYYEGRKLRSKKHPRLGYYFAPILFQGISRVRKGLALIVTEKGLLSGIMSLFPARDGR